MTNVYNDSSSCEIYDIYYVKLVEETKSDSYVVPL